MWKFSITKFNNSIVQKNILRLLGVIGILLLIYVCFYRLGSFRLENWDEAWYADMMRNVTQTGNLAVMYWNKYALLDKPPLYIWLGALSSFFFGHTELAYRLPSALAGFVTIILITGYALRRWGLLAAIMAFGTLALNNVYMWRVRTANLDSFVTLLIVLVFFTTLSKHKLKYVALGFLFAFIFLAKASLVVMPIVFILASEILYEHKHIIGRIPQYLIMVLIPIVICGSWLYAGSLQIGPQFATYYLFHSDQNVARITLENFKTDYIMFAYYALQRRFMYAFVLGLILLIWKIKNKDSFLIITFSTALLFLLSFTERKNNWYLVPAMPFWSLVIGYGISETIRFFKKDSRIQTSLIAFVLLIGGYIFFKTLTVNIQALIDSSGPVDQAAAALYIQSKARPDDIIIRTDQLYPTTIYYSGLKTYAFNADAGISHIGIGEKDFSQLLSENKVQWISGTSQDVDRFYALYLSDLKKNIVYSNGTESVIYVSH